MKPHRVISAFKHAGQLIEPPCMWTPPSEAVAEKLVRARCLKPPFDVAKGGPIEININGGAFSREQVVGLLEEINKAAAESQVVGAAPEAPGLGGTMATIHVPPPEPEPSSPKSRRRKK